MAPPLDLPSTIKAVTVYRRGALITREAALPSDASELPRRVQLVGLPLGLEDSSMRVELRGGAGVVAGDLQVTLAVPGSVDELPPPTNAQLEAARLALELAKIRVSELEHARERLAQLVPMGRGKPEEGKAPAASPTIARLQLLEFRSARHLALSEQLAEARATLPKLEEQLATLRERERRASSARNARAHELRKAAIVTLEREGELSVEGGTLALHYYVPGARWAPSYTVRLDRAMKAASLELRAMVGQATGEDWQGVSLTLSTANPQQWTELPELDSRRIGRRQPPPVKTGWRSPPVGADALYADYDRGLGEPDDPEDDGGDDDDVEEEERSVLFDLEALAEVDDAPPPPPPGPPMSFGGAVPGGAPMPMAPMQQGFPEPEIESSKMRKRAAKPMPTRSAAMAPPAMVQPQALAMRKSGGIGNLVGSAIDGLASAFSPSDVDFDGGYGGGGGPGGYYGSEPETELLAGRALLDYGRLRLHGGAHAQRGALRRVSLRVQYEQISVERLSVDLAFSQIKEAREWASLLETERAPEGHDWPTGEGGFDYAYVATASVDLRSTGGFRSLPVDLREASSRPRYVSVPRESQDVFRIVGVDNPFAAPLLPGPVDVYVDGKFMLTSHVELTPAKGKIELGIGVEQAIKIARNVSFSEESSGMFKRSSMLEHTLELEVQNHLGDAALVEIRERVPIVPDHGSDDIEVTIGEVSPRWEDYEPKRTGPDLEGGKRWKIEVPAGQKRELKARYSIRIPTNYELVGGNRRES